MTSYYRYFILAALVRVITDSAQAQISKDDQVLLDSFYIKMYNKFNNKRTILMDKSTGDTAYYCQLASRNTFDSLLKPIINRVVLDNNNLINTGTAYALSADAGKAQLNGNFSWLSKKENKYWNVGLAASSSTKVFQILSKDEWQQGISLSLGITKAIKPPLGHETDLEDYCIQKNRYLISQLVSLKNDLEGYANNLSALDLLDSSKLLMNNGFSRNLNRELDVQQITSTSNLNNIKNSILKVTYLRSSLRDGLLETYVDSLLTDYEKVAIHVERYTLKWFNLKFIPQYKGTTIYDTSAARILGLRKNQYLRLSIEGSYNRARSTPNSLLFLTLSVGAQNSNSLEGKKADQLQFLKSNVTDSSVVLTSTKGIAIEDYGSYKKQFPLVTPSFGFNWFWGQSKTFGWETFLSAKIGVRKAEIPFKNLYSFRSGVLISLKGDSEITKSTIGLLAEWADKDMSSRNYHDFFTLNFRIGIPFTY